MIEKTQRYLRLARATIAYALAIVTAFCANAPSISRAKEASPPAYGVGAVVENHGYPEFRLGGKPFLMYGAAFFYERLPESEWYASMQYLRRLGFNTLDLYVPWNWHELADGDFDFEGRTNPRRNLREVLELAKSCGFYLIVRPGPVIRNEWRNGGYPQWLLERPDYSMPQRDVLEGRYPATATLQNQHSDDAAAQWMQNPTHVRYARRWLERALHEFDPVADRVLGVALDDDQGAYIDNQTWPAPHLAAYLESLRATVQGVTGPDVPTFINTYQMKVTASAPVWAMGNWYQSDAFTMGEHDRSQLEFSTGLLQTRPGQPLWTSEFQAGWLQQPQDVVPQGADPSNTILALGTMLQLGVRGVVDFPGQDTLAPAGYEAPFSNAFYAWDAALGYELPNETTYPWHGRARPTGQFGDTVRTYGAQLAATHVVYDASIAWLGSAFDPASMTNDDFGTLADRTLATQRACREAGLTCRFIDLRYASDADLARSKLILLPRANAGPLASRAFAPEIARRLRRVVAAGVPVASLVHVAAIDRDHIASIARDAALRPVVTGALDAVYAASNDTPGRGFVVLVNYGQESVSDPAVTVSTSAGHQTTIHDVRVAARSIAVLPIDLPISSIAEGFAPGDVIETASCNLSLRDFGDRGSSGLEAYSEFTPAVTPCVLVATIGGRTTSYRPEQADVIDTRGELFHQPTVTIAGVGLAPPPQDLTKTLAVPVRRDVLLPAFDLPLGRATEARATMMDIYQDGFPAVLLSNDLVDVVVSPNAGGRAFVFQDRARNISAFDSVGALRDDVAVQPPLSTSDRIAKYTHQFPAGFFNRPYDAKIVQSGARAVVELSYTAPDAFPGGATFTRTLTLEPHSRDLVVDETATFPGGTQPAQHGVAITSLAVGDPRVPTSQHVLPEGTTFSQKLAPPSEVSSGTIVSAGLYDDVTHEAILVVSGDGLRRELVPADDPHTLVVTADVARTGTTRTIFRYDFPPDLAAATRELAAMPALVPRREPAPSPSPSP